MKKYLAEVPRFFTTVEAKDDNEFKELLKVEASKVAEEHAKFEDVTGKELPSAKDALTARSNSLLNKIVNIVETGKSITKATGGTAFLGVSGGDVVFRNELGTKLGLEINSNADYLSFGSYLGGLIKKPE